MALALALSALALAGALGDEDALPPLGLAVLQWGLAGLLLLRLRRACGADAAELQFHVMLDLALLGALLAATGTAATPFAAAGLLPMVALARAGGGSPAGAAAPAARRRRPAVPATAPAPAASALPGDVASAGVDLDFAAVVGGLAHDAASPLAAVVVVSAELRHDYAHDPRLQDDLALIDAQVQACRAQLSALAHTCIAACDREPAPLSLQHFVDDALQAARARWPGVGLAGPCAAPDLWMSPPLVLRQTLGQLLDNAARACRSGVELRVSVDGGRLQFEVTDDGDGFDPELLSGLGQRPLERPCPSAGLGCGLVLGALAARILGGTLELGNRAPAGARVRLGLALTAVQALQAPPAPSTTATIHARAAH